MEIEFNDQLLYLSLLTAQDPEELQAEVETQLLGYYDSLALLKSCGYTVPDVEQIESADRLLYMYMDAATADLCMWMHCLVWNRGNSGARVTSLPPYLRRGTCAEIYSKLDSIIDRSSTIGSQEQPPNNYFVALLPSQSFEKTGELSVSAVDGDPLAFDVFTRQRQSNDPNGNYFKYEDVICAGRCLFGTNM